MKKVMFLMPAVAHRPTGGFKVIYEYANRFSWAGYDVTCCYSVTPPTPYVDNAGFFVVLAKHIVKLLFNYYTCRSWFALEKNVHEIHVWNLKQKNIPYADSYIATAVRTSYFLDLYKIDKTTQKKFYLIQDFENWGCPDKFVNDSYRLGLKKIVISDWLLAKVKAQGENALLCYNGFDFNYFKMIIPPENRNHFVISMLYHEERRKRCIDAFSALELVKKRFPDLTVNIFGQYEKPRLPSWYKYYRRPDKMTHVSFLNNSAIFIYASEAEGLALPPAEAMICGCAVCGTDIPGIPYNIQNYTGLVSPVGDVNSLADNIIRLILDKQLRVRLAYQGHDYICQNYIWEKSVNKIIQEFEK